MGAYEPQPWGPSLSLWSLVLVRLEPRRPEQQGNVVPALVCLSVCPPWLPFIWQ